MAAQETQAKKDAKTGIWSRRDFFTRLGWGGFGVFGFLGLLGFIRSAFPRVLFQPPTTFKGGRPEDFAIGEVSEKFKQEFAFGLFERNRGSMHYSRSALTSDARHAGCLRKINLNARVTEAAFLKTEQTSKGRRPGRWTVSRLRWQNMDS